MLPILQDATPIQSAWIVTERRVESQVFGVAMASHARTGRTAPCPTIAPLIFAWSQGLERIGLTNALAFRG